MATETNVRNWEAWLPVLSGQRKGVWAVCLRGMLWGLSAVYWVGLLLRNRRWRDPANRRRAAVPVISVGNLTTGGTGKTPFVQWLCRDLRRRSLRVALLSRGYGSGGGGPNDEALELELSLPDVPHLQDPDRVQIAQVAVEELEAQCLVMDDGFQHRRLERDLDIVLVDATCPFGYGYLLPRGLLREPLSALRRADAVVLTRCDQVPADQVRQVMARLKPHLRTESTPVIQTVHRPIALLDSLGRRRPLSELEGRPVGLFAGVGNPQAFFGTVEALGGRVLATRTYPDHYAYQREDLAELRRWVDTLSDARQVKPSGPLGSGPDDVAEPNSAARPWVITTRKDLVKLDLLQIAGCDLVALEIELQFLAGESQLLDLIQSCTAGIPREVVDLGS